MTETSTQAIQYAHQHHDRFLSDLENLVSIPSISTDPDHKGDMQRAAQWLADHMQSIGLDHVQVMQTAGHPVIYADWLRAKGPTVLIYGHYDVQPVEPLDEWKTGPFKPEVLGDLLFGRGASDMKGQVMASLDAVESILKTGSLPVNIKFMLEGEEEIGSPSLGEFMEDHKDLLSCEIALNPDSGMIAPDIPTIVYGLRGLAYFELRVYGPAHDLHSGLFGGIVHNPAQALCELIAGMHDDQGRVTLPGFYDSVRQLSAEERSELARLPLTDDYYLEQTGAPMTWGETGYSAAERVGARPTLEIHGLLSGFTGTGSKTVIPANAMAKISCRLVPDQDPAEVYQQLVRYLNEKAPKDIRWELVDLHGGPASMTDPQLPAAQALASALEVVWEIAPVYKREGGSIPVVADMQKILGVDSVLTGFGLPGDNVHAPNEHLNLPVWFRGIDALIYFFYNMANNKP